MKIAEICARDVIVARPTDSILEVARLMRQYHVGDIVIVDHQNELNIPVGIVTDRDIVLELVAKEIDINSVTTGDIMSADLLVVKDEDELPEVIQLMQAKGVRRAPVVDARGALIGIVTEDDLIEIISEQVNHLVSIVNRGVHKEHIRRT